MRARKPLPRELPRLWLVTDKRNDAALERAIARLPRGSGVIFRHRHLAEAERTARLREVRALCRRFGHRLEVTGVSYGPPGPHRLLATAHGLREIGRANRFGAEAVLLSPVYPTRSHPGARALGRSRFLLLAKRSRVPVIALGGMSAARFRGLPVYGWSAIDALSRRAEVLPKTHATSLISNDS